MQGIPERLKAENMKRCLSVKALTLILSSKQVYLSCKVVKIMLSAVGLHFQADEL